MDDVPFGADFELILEQLFQKFGGDVLMFEATHFGQELVAQDGYVGPWKSSCCEYVDDLAFGGDGFGDELADGRVDLFGGLTIDAALLVQRGLQGLEEGNVFANLRCFIARGAEGKGFVAKSCGKFISG